MSNVNREERYTVLKISDVHGALNANETEQLIYLEEKIDAYRELRGKGALVCVVVESDWPEYEPTWESIVTRSRVAK